MSRPLDQCTPLLVISNYAFYEAFYGAFFIANKVYVMYNVNINHEEYV